MILRFFKKEKRKLLTWVMKYPRYAMFLVAGVFMTNLIISNKIKKNFHAQTANFAVNISKDEHQPRLYRKSTEDEAHNMGRPANANDKSEFEKQWYRIQSLRLDWQRLLLPCAKQTVLGETLPGWGEENATSLSWSFVDYKDVRPAGHFSKFFIRTRTSDGRNKTVGGDYWKLLARGPADVAATVFDLGNGSYEAVALIVDPGEYEIVASVRRTLCEGMKDPTAELYSLVSYVERRRMNPARVVGNEPGCCLHGSLPSFNITVPPGKDSFVQKITDAIYKPNCVRSCSFIWSGLGRWIKNEWVPFLPSDNQPLLPVTQKKQDTLYFVGDSVMKQLSGVYQTDRKGENTTCDLFWKSCKEDYFHMYPWKSKLHPDAIERGRVEYNEVKKYGNSTLEFKPQMIFDGLKEVFQEPGMNNSESLLLFNTNFHLARTITFAVYKDFIDNVTYLLSNRYKLLGSKARVVWRTTTAIKRRKTDRRLVTSKFLTNLISVTEEILTEVEIDGVSVSKYYDIVYPLFSPDLPTIDQLRMLGKFFDMFKMAEFE